MWRVEPERQSLTLGVGCEPWALLHEEQKYSPTLFLVMFLRNLVEKCLWVTLAAFSDKGCLYEHI